MKSYFHPLAIICLLVFLGACSPTAIARPESDTAIALAPSVTSAPLIPTAQGPVLVSATPLPTLRPTMTPRPSATPTTLPSATPTTLPSATPTATLPPTATPPPVTPVRPTPWPTATGPLDQAQRVMIFDTLWELIATRYIDPGFNGVDWTAQRTFFRPRALQAANDEHFYGELRTMVETLDDDHSHLMTPNEAIDHFRVSRNSLTYNGFGIYSLTLYEGALILQVMPGSPAAQAGLQPCDTVLTLNGERYVEGGNAGSGGTLRVWRPNVGELAFTLSRTEIEQVLQVPGTVLPVEGGRIGYARVDTLWVREMPDRLRATLAALEAEAPLDGLVLDLRSNMGGWRFVLERMLGLFLDGERGEFTGRLEQERLTARPPDGQAVPYPDLPLIVLVSDHTESYAEVLAGVLQAERGAVVIGAPTQGNVETIYPRPLPFGAYVWIAEQGFRLPNGRNLEGVGVQPDILDETDWTRFPCAGDPQVERAATLLRERILVSTP